jgi:hypothetical protein
MNKTTFGRKAKKFFTGSLMGVGLTLTVAVAAFAATVVTPTNTQGWSTADTNSGGAVNFVADATAPSGAGALQLTTDATNEARAQYLHATSTPIADVTELSYSTKQNTASFSGAAASYQLPVLLNGTTGFTTLVFEPYENGTVTNGTWQDWDVANGQFWSSRTVTCSNGTITAGAGGAPFYTLSDIKTMCPEAVVVGFGVNIGTYNPSYDVETDLVNFNGTVYDFEPVVRSAEINSPTAGSTVSGNVNFTASLTDDDPDPIQWAVRQGTCATGTNTVFGNVDGHTDSATIDQNDLSNQTFSFTGDMSSLTPGTYCFVYNPVEDSGESNIRLTSEFTLEAPNVVVGPPTDKNECKDNGWKTFNSPTFKNQGQCVSYVQANPKAGK